MTITENLEKLSLSDLNDIAEKYGIDKKDIQGSGKSGRVLKSDIVLAIRDHEARLHDGKPLKIKTAEKKKKTSPKKKSPKKTSPKKKSPKKKPSITVVSSPENGKRIVSVEKLTAVEALVELRKHKKYAKMTDYQIKKSIGGSSVAKIADIRQEVRNLMSEGKVSPSPKKKSPKKKSPKKKSPKKKSPKKKSPKKVTPEKKKKSPKKKPVSSSLKCEDRKKCPGCYCDTHNGKCVSKNKDGKPRGEKSLREEIGDDYVYDEKYGLVGSEADVKAHIKLWKKKHAEKKVAAGKKTPPKKISPKKTSPKKKTPPKKTSPVKPRKTCGSSDMKSFDGYSKCEEDEICSVLTGKCVKDAATSRAGQHVLNIDGRSIIGDLETIRKLQKELGGEIVKESKISPQKPEKKTSPKKKSPVKPKSPKKSPEPKKKSPVKKAESAIVAASREDIYRTFTECLAKLK
jgi:hypothetical protein